MRIEEICAVAQVSRGTFYNYFTSLQQLFEILAVELSHDLNRALVATFDETQSHAEGANAAIQHYLNYARRDPAWAWAMVHLSAFGPTFGSEAWAACHRAIAKGIEAGEFDVPNAVAGRDLMTGTVLATVRTTLRGGRSQPRAIAHHVLRALGVPDARAREITESPLPDIVVPNRRARSRVRRERRKNLRRRERRTDVCTRACRGPRSSRGWRVLFCDATAWTGRTVFTELWTRDDVIHDIEAELERLWRHAATTVPE